MVHDRSDARGTLRSATKGDAAECNAPTRSGRTHHQREPASLSWKPRRGTIGSLPVTSLSTLAYPIPAAPSAQSAVWSLRTRQGLPAPEPRHVTIKPGTSSVRYERDHHHRIHWRDW